MHPIVAEACAYPFSRDVAMKPWRRGG